MYSATISSVTFPVLQQKYPRPDMCCPPILRGEVPTGVHLLQSGVDIAVIASGSATRASKLRTSTLRLISPRKRRPFRNWNQWTLIHRATSPPCPAGAAIRALAWLGPKGASEALRTLRRKLSPSELQAVVGVRGRLPAWMAQEVSALVNNGRPLPQVAGG